MIRALLFTIFAVGAALGNSAPALAHALTDLVGGEAAVPGEVTVAGMLDGRQDRIRFDDVSITINGEKAQLAPDGHFAATTPIAPYYRVDITGPRIFTTVQTFGNAELRDDACQCLSIPAIELVARRKGRVELFFGGDSMVGRRFFTASRGEEPVLNRATLDRDLDTLFSAIKPYLQSSDVASLNLESVLAAEQPGPASPKKYLFFSPPELAGALARAGIDHVSLGNNHTADYSAPGMRTTIDALNDAGVAWSGGGMDAQEAERASRIVKNQEKLGLYGFVGWRGDWTPNQVAEEGKAGAAWGRRSTVERVTKRERRAGYAPIMQFHGNPEYSDRPSEVSLSRFRAAVDKGAPLVIGHHPHVTHGLEIYRDGLIAHSLGNFLFDQDRPQTQTTYALKVWLEDGEFLRAEAIPLQVLDYRPVPAVGGMREAVLRRLHWLSAEMGTNMLQSGGHSIVWRKTRKAKDESTRQGCRAGETFNLNNFMPSCATTSGRRGRNIIPRGDFENARFGEASDRFWRTRHAAIDYRRSSEGEGYMTLLPESAGKSTYLYSRAYLRDIYSTRFTLEARVRLPRAAQVELLIKERPKPGETATPSVRGVSSGSQRVRAGEWQKLTFDFARPEETDGIARAFRPILKIRFENTSEAGEKTIKVDDIALIEWSSAPDRTDSAQSWRWTHVRSDDAQILAAQ